MLDTATKRRAAASLPFGTAFTFAPAPDGEITAADRYSLGGFYLPATLSPPPASPATSSQRRALYSLPLGPFFEIGPSPDGSIGTGDRYSLAGFYLPGEGLTIPGIPDWRIVVNRPSKTRLIARG